LVKEDREIKDKRLRELIERLRAQVKNLEDDKALLNVKNEDLKKEMASLTAELDKRLPLGEIKDANTRKLIEELQGKVRSLEETNRDVTHRLKDKDDSNAKIANLCNILLQDKTSLIDANRRLAESLDQMRNTIKQLEESNLKMQERIEETRKSLGLDQLKTNF
jgi:chromosome segregation ATPase